MRRFILVLGLVAGCSANGGGSSGPNDGGQQLAPDGALDPYGELGDLCGFIPDSGEVLTTCDDLEWRLEKLEIEVECTQLNPYLHETRCTINCASFEAQKACAQLGGECRPRHPSSSDTFCYPPGRDQWL